MSKSRINVLIPIDSNTVAAGAREVKNALSAEIGKRGLSDEITVVETAAFGPTNTGVLVAVQPDNVVYANITVANVAEIVEEHFVKGRQCKKFILAGEKPSIPSGETDARKLQELGRIVLDNCGVINPEDIKEYIARDGYFALGTAVTEMKPEDVIKVVKDSGLRGRGGAGFPTGLKWSFCSPVKSKEKYVICNADEGEPGTFKDRLIMEGDPHKVVEGMAICGYAIGANMGFIYIRGEYKLSINRLQKAIDDARKLGFLGRKIFGSAFNFDIEIKIGAGAYVCGEETALIESMEGKRGLPRLKPPFPAQCGFRGKPTNVNNVETLANVPPIIRNGAAWFKKFGTPGTPGTKVYTVLGHINRPGLIEVPAGVTLREIIYGYGGGMKSGKFHFAQLGGTAGDILGEEMLDVPLDYDAMQKNGHVLGSGAILIVNDSVNMNDFLHSCMKFFVHESCGNCNPCRNGLKIMKDITGRLKENKAYDDDIDGLEEISMILKSAAFCPLGQSPAGPIMSSLRYFRNEISKGIDTKNTKPAVRHVQRDLTVLTPV